MDNTVKARASGAARLLVLGAALLLLLAVESRAAGTSAQGPVPDGTEALIINSFGIVEDAKLRVSIHPSQSLVVNNGAPKAVKLHPAGIAKQVYKVKGNDCDENTLVDWAAVFPDAPLRYPYVSTSSGHDNGASAALFRIPGSIYLPNPAEFCFILRDDTRQKQYTVIVSAFRKTF